VFWSNEPLLHQLVCLASTFLNIANHRCKPQYSNKSSRPSAVSGISGFITIRSCFSTVRDYFECGYCPQRLSCPHHYCSKCQVYVFTRWFNNSARAWRTTNVKRNCLQIPINVKSKCTRLNKFFVCILLHYKVLISLGSWHKC